MSGPSISRGIVAQTRALLVGQVAVMSFAVVDTVLTGHASAVDLATLGLGLSDPDPPRRSTGDLPNFLRFEPRPAE